LTDEDGNSIAVNAARIAFVDRNYDGGTFITFSDGSERLFREEPDEVERRIAKLEARQAKKRTANRVVFVDPVTFEAKGFPCAGGVMVVADYGTNAEWEAALTAQQRALLAAARG